MIPLQQESIPVAQLPGITWTLVIFLVTTVFAAGINIMRMIQFEAKLKEMKAEHDIEINGILSTLTSHITSDVRHTLDGPNERRTQQRNSLTIERIRERLNIRDEAH